MISYGAFWDFLFPPGVVDQTLYPGQSYLMFITYALLHAGTIHVLMNAAIFIALGKTALHYGLRLTLMTMLLGAVCSGITFGLLETTAAPMVGASGVVFALIGVWLQTSRAEGLADRTSSKISVGSYHQLNSATYFYGYLHGWSDRMASAPRRLCDGVLCRSLVCWPRKITDMISVI